MTLLAVRDPREMPYMSHSAEHSWEVNFLLLGTDGLSVLQQCMQPSMCLPKEKWSRDLL